MHRLKHIVRWEFLIFFLTMVLVFNFAYEPNQRALIESLFEQHYTDLKRFHQVHQSITTKQRLTASDRRYARHVLSNLMTNGFILKPEVYYTLGMLYEREKIYPAALSAYEAMLSLIGNESFLKRDAFLGMSRIHQAQRRTAKAREKLELAWQLPTTYRQLETGFALLEIYDKANENEKKKQILLSLETITPNYVREYTSFARRIWKYFSPEEQRQILERNFSPLMTKLLWEQGRLYISEHKPSVEWVEKWAIFIASHSDDAILRPLENFLRQVSGYTVIADHLRAYRNLNVTAIPNASSSAQAAYVHRALRSISRGARYQPDRAERHYQTFLTRGFTEEYVSRNLELLIRNLLAYKRFDRIVTWVSNTYERLALSPTSVDISAHTAFWYAYSAWEMNMRDIALWEWGRTIAINPHNYFGALALHFLQHNFSETELADYKQSIESQRQRTRNPSERLFHTRILYALADNPLTKEGHRAEIERQLARLYPQLFDSTLPELETLSLEKYFRYLVYSRFGFTDYAREILYKSGIQNETAVQLAILNVLVYYKNFDEARRLFSRIENHPSIRNHVGFLPRDFRKVLFPLPYVQEAHLALSMQTNAVNNVYLVHAVIKGESLFYPRAVSRVGARGLMQLMPATARMLIPAVFENRNVSLYDPVNNIILGTRFLNYAIDTHGLIGGLITYNGGARVLHRTRRRFRPDNDIILAEILPFAETRLYVRKIMSYYKMYLSTYENRTFSLDIPATNRRLLTRR